MKESGISALAGKMGKMAAGLVLAPSLLVLLIGLLFGWGMKSASLAVYNEDTGFEMPGIGKTCIPDQLVEGLDKKIFSVFKAKSEEEAFRAVKEGRASVALSFPKDFTQEMMIKMDDPSYIMNVKVRVKVDKANPIVTLITVTKMGEALSKNLKGAKLGDLPLPIDLSPLQEGGLPNVGAFIMPGLFILLLFILSVMATVNITFHLRDENPGVPEKTFRLPLIALFTVIYVLQAVLLYVTGALIFRITIPGNLCLASLPVIALVFTGASFGVFFASVRENRKKLPGAILFAVLPIFFSGVILPLELLPVWLRWICFLFPPYYSVQSFRSFTLYGDNIVWGLGSCGILLLFGILFTVLTAVTGKNESNKSKEAGL